jgi:hypothetical protein
MPSASTWCSVMKSQLISHRTLCAAAATVHHLWLIAPQSLRISFAEEAVRIEQIIKKTIANDNDYYIS